MHVIDCATFEPGRDPLTDLDVIEAELAAHGGLEDRPRLVALNKVDVPDAAELAEMVAGRPARPAGCRVFAISTKTGPGLQALTFAMAELVAAAPRRGAAAGAAADRAAARAGPGGGGRVRGRAREGELWRVRGDKPERWVRQTDFGNPEAVGYLADRLNRIGIEDRLLELGARAGDGVAIGGDGRGRVRLRAADRRRRRDPRPSRRGPAAGGAQRPAAQRRRGRTTGAYHAASARPLTATTPCVADGHRGRRRER